MMEIPESYSQRMQELLGDEFDEYLASLDEIRTTSLRVNTSKTDREEVLRLLHMEESTVPWVEEGLYYPEDLRPAKTPLWHGGLIYIQEASAMTPGSVIPIQPGDRVLDLCAAPGGKATQTAARLNGTGVIYANDISTSRAQALLKNLEMSGTSRVFVTAETPAHLCERFPEHFDVILVDAPCSGEGMIRKDAAMFKDWLAKGPAYYQPIQAEILEQAVQMLAPGGCLLYSTCTFSREEDEDNVIQFLANHPEMSLIDIPLRPGFSRGFLLGTVRLWPHHTKGEGHFLALMRKAGERPCRSDLIGSVSRALGYDPVSESRSAYDSSPSSATRKTKGKKNGKKDSRNRKDRFASSDPSTDSQYSVEFPLKELCSDVLKGTVIQRIRDSLYAIPEGETIHPGLHYLRTGLLLGEWKKERFVPSQALAMALSGKKYPNRIALSMDNPLLIRYLKGETLNLDEEDIYGEEGWVLVCGDDHAMGWGIRSGNQLKNKYTPGWRMM